jgi:hypothetical protein
MKYDEVKAILLLAGLQFSGINKIPNGYWPAHQNYDEVREANPWWVVHIEGEGVITIGWRKKVIHIDWSMTRRRGTVTEDDVTKDDSMVHAWGVIDAVKYLRAFRELPVADMTIPGMRSYIVEGKDKVLEALRMLGDDSHEMVLLKQAVDGAKEGWPTIMSISRKGDSGHSFHLRVGKLSIHYYQDPE